MTDTPTTGTAPTDEPDTDPLALLFPGQGSQAPGMGRRVFEHSGAAREVFAEASEYTHLDIAAICFEGDADSLAETTYTQPAVVTTSIAIIAAMREKLHEAGQRVRPRLFGGHSLGLFSAAVAAEALTFRDALFMVLERSKLMSSFNSARPVGMASIIGLDAEAVRAICVDATLSPADRVDVANYNLDNQTVISGDLAALERGMERARAQQGKVIQLKVKVSSHTPLHVDQAQAFAQMIHEVPIADPQRPIVSNRSSELLRTGAELRLEFEQQLCSPVYWADNVRRMCREGVDTFVEVGPGHVLARMVKRISDSLITVSLDDAEVEPIPISILPAELAR